MAMFTNTIYNDVTKRHEFEYINQQMDFIVGVRWYEEFKEYRMCCSNDEFRKLTTLWHGKPSNIEDVLPGIIQGLLKADADKLA